MPDSFIRPDADEAWDDLLRQLPRQPKARPRPFFYSRVQARIAAAAPKEKHLLPDWLRRPAYALLLGALVLGLTGDCAAGGATGAGYQAQPVLQR